VRIQRREKVMSTKADLPGSGGLQRLRALPHHDPRRGDGKPGRRWAAIAAVGALAASLAVLAPAAAQANVGKGPCIVDVRATPYTKGPAPVMVGFSVTINDEKPVGGKADWTFGDGGTYPPNQEHVVDAVHLYKKPFKGWARITYTDTKGQFGKPGETCKGSIYLNFNTGLPVTVKYAGKGQGAPPGLEILKFEGTFTPGNGISNWVYFLRVYDRQGTLKAEKKIAPVNGRSMREVLFNVAVPPAEGPFTVWLTVWPQDYGPTSVPYGASVVTVP
jgi:hypothetical protein